MEQGTIYIDLYRKLYWQQRYQLNYKPIELTHTCDRNKHGSSTAGVNCCICYYRNTIPNNSSTEGQHQQQQPGQHQQQARASATTSIVARTANPTQRRCAALRSCFPSNPPLVIIGRFLESTKFQPVRRPLRRRDASVRCRRYQKTKRRRASGPQNENASIEPAASEKVWTAELYTRR